MKNEKKWKIVTKVKFILKTIFVRHFILSVHRKFLLEVELQIKLIDVRDLIYLKYMLLHTTSNDQ